MFADDYSPTSSLLPYEPIALQEYPFLGKQVTVKVHVKPFDSILQDHKGIDLVLVDVQGYQDKVLPGANGIPKSYMVVISELSLQPLYAGSSTFNSVYQFLVRAGFRLRFLTNPMQGEGQQILQIDGVFVREGAEGTR